MRGSPRTGRASRRKSMNFAWPVAIRSSKVVSGARADRAQLKRAIAALDAGDILLVTRLDRLARSTRDLLNIVAAIAEKGAQFRSMRDAWADTTTAHGRLMLTVLGGLA